MTFKQANNLIKKIKEHNNYEAGWDDVDVCSVHNLWTPYDLVCREYLNNGGGSAKGFLGITTRKCIELYRFIVDNLDEIVKANLLSKDGYNNHGFALWRNYNLY